MNKFLKILDKPSEDELLERIEREPIVKKYGLFFSASLLSLWIAAIANILIAVKNNETPPAELYAVKKVNGGYSIENAEFVPITLPTAHNTFKNVSAWLKEAITETYSFNFLDYQEKLKSVEGYFTPEGYTSYLNAIETSGLVQEISGKKMNISIITLDEPIMINSGEFQNTEFWRFRTRVLVSYSAGSTPKEVKYIVEILIKKVPSYVNPKSLSIHEYNMRPL